MEWGQIGTSQEFQLQRVKVLTNETYLLPRVGVHVRVLVAYFLIFTWVWWSGNGNNIRARNR